MRCLHSDLSAQRNQIPRKYCAAESHRVNCFFFADEGGTTPPALMGIEKREKATLRHFYDRNNIYLLCVD